MPSFLRGHVASFGFFDAVPRVVLYDNLKSAVIEREGDAVRFHPTLLALAGHYRFEPRACAPYRPNEKGRVERAIQDVRANFFAAREFASLDDLNAQAQAWCIEIACERRVPDQKDKTVAAAMREDKAAMIPLAEDEFPVEERVEVRAGKTPYVRFDKNDYATFTLTGCRRSRTATSRSSVAARLSRGCRWTTALPMSGPSNCARWSSLATFWSIFGRPSPPRAFGAS
jgi:hypothetical protein